MVRFESPTERYGVVESVIWTIVALGAANHLFRILGFDLVVVVFDGLNVQSRTVYLIVGLLGVINLANLYTAGDLTDTVDGGA
jgi:uncharacterized membrane protein YuzA (DUF378 family)